MARRKRFEAGLSATSSSRDVNNFVKREFARGSNIGDGSRSAIRSFAKRTVSRLAASSKRGRSSGS